MNNSQIALKFAQGKEKGTASNMFIRDDTIFSYGYHFPIAQRTDKLQDGRKVALFTMRSYSNSTAKHKNHVYNALVQENYFIIPVWFVDAGVNKGENARLQLEEAIKASQKAKRARSEEMRKYWIQQETRFLMYRNSYLALF